MEEWSKWVIDSDPTDMIQQIRSVLVDRKRSYANKVEALTLLTNMADQESMELLTWYRQHADPGMELTATLALMEAERLSRPPKMLPWHERLLIHIQEAAEHFHSLLGEPPLRDAFHALFVSLLRAEGFPVEENGRALLKYNGELIEIASVDLIVKNQLIICYWDREDEEAALEEWADSDDYDEDVPEPMLRFYNTLRVSNMSWGIYIDLSGDEIESCIVENMEVDRGWPVVEYVLALN